MRVAYTRDNRTPEETNDLRTKAKVEKGAAQDAHKKKGGTRNASRICSIFIYYLSIRYRCIIMSNVNVYP